MLDYVSAGLIPCNAIALLFYLVAVHLKIGWLFFYDVATGLIAAYGITSLLDLVAFVAFSGIDNNFHGDSYGSGCGYEDDDKCDDGGFRHLGLLI